jgi:hypothetical protein
MIGGPGPASGAGFTGKNVKNTPNIPRNIPYFPLHFYRKFAMMSAILRQFTGFLRRLD